MNSGKILYENGALWKCWEPRRNWLPNPKRAEKSMSNGYFMLRTTINYIYLSVMAHRVIWCYFNGVTIIPAGLDINHLDFNRRNNKIENLQLVTPKENINYTKDNGRARYATEFENSRCIISNDSISKIHLLRNSGLLQKDIAEMYGVRPNQISRILTGKRRSRYGKDESEEIWH